jgi:hypothetical protein
MSSGLEPPIVCFEQEKDCRVVGTGGGRIEWGSVVADEIYVMFVGLGVISDRCWDVHTQ